MRRSGTRTILTLRRVPGHNDSARFLRSRTSFLSGETLCCARAARAPYDGRSSRHHSAKDGLRPMEAGFPSAPLGEVLDLPPKLLHRDGLGQEKGRSGQQALDPVARVVVLRRGGDEDDRGLLEGLDAPQAPAQLEAVDVGK